MFRALNVVFSDVTGKHGEPVGYSRSVSLGCAMVCLHFSFSKKSLLFMYKLRSVLELVRYNLHMLLRDYISLPFPPFPARLIAFTFLLSFCSDAPS